MRDRYYDNTRISTAKRCFRKYFFRHVVDWEGTSFQKHLAFGSAWHEGMDEVWTILAKNPKAPTKDVVQVAYTSWVECWIKNGGTHPDEMGPDDMADLAPQNPMVALEMLYNYVDCRRDFFAKDFELLDVEKAFAVPLDPEDDSLFYVGRMDKVFAKKGLIYVGEHKTTSQYSRDFIFRSTFIDGFSPNSQVDGYLHAIHMLYGEKATAVWVDAALVHKKIHDKFKFIPIERQEAQLDSWLYDTHWWIGAIEDNWHRLDDLQESGDNTPYMSAFPKNTEACQDFAKNCPYLGVCKMVPNPLNTDVPAGFKKERWSPFDRLGLDEIGLSEQKDK